MGIKGENSKERILSVAEQIILKKGYSSTSIDEIIDKACITKSGFFYHFRSKNELALFLVKRYLKQDDEFFNGLFERADSLSEDPLQQMLIFLKLMAEAMNDLPNGHPGCLIACFIYESMLFEEELLDLVADGMLGWRMLFLGRLKLINTTYPMKLDISHEDLSDALVAIIEGAIVMSLTLKKPEILANQILQYRSYLRLLFSDV